MELKALSGEPDAIEGVTHATPQPHRAGPVNGQPGDPNLNTPEGVAHSEINSTQEETEMNVSTYLDIARPEVLMG